MKEAEQGGQCCDEGYGEFRIRGNKTAEQEKRKTGPGRSSRDSKEHSGESTREPGKRKNPQYAARRLCSSPPGKKSECNYRDQIFRTQQQMKNAVVDRAEPYGW
jgi:hypothetical protein